MLETKNINHSYSGSEMFEFPDIKCEPAQTLLILGQSGVGKTTLLHILAGILKPKNGEVIIGPKSIYTLSGNQLDKFRGQNIGLVFQRPHFVQSISAEENLLLTQSMAGHKSDKNAVNSLMDRLNIGNRKNAKTYQMSQGEQQRLSIARALINKPRIILADEPTSALDDTNCKEVIQLLEQQANEVNASLIVVTHDNRLTDFFKHHINLS